MKKKPTRSRLNFVLLFFAAMILVFPAVAMAEPKAGDVIDKTNIEQYKEYLPSFMVQMAVDGGAGIDEPIVIHVKDYGENLEPASFRNITRENTGKTTLNSDGTMNGYVAGLPFPDAKEPNKALKVMWNYTYRWRGDDFQYPGGYTASTKRKGGRIGYSLSEVKQVKFDHRTAIEPKPSQNNPRELLFGQLFISMTPPNKDIQNLMWRYKDPYKDDEMWAYIPTLRRTLRLVSSERSNPVRGSAYTWDDFYGFDGQPMKYDFKLVDEKPMLVIVNQNTLAKKDTKYERGYDRPVMDGPEDPFEIRKVYIVEAKSKDPRNPESKKVLYILSDIHNCVYSEIYDKSGVFWKGLTLNFAKLPTENGETGPWATGSSMIDFKTQFWTYALLNKVAIDSGIEPQIFSPGALGTF